MEGWVQTVVSAALGERMPGTVARQSADSRDHPTEKDITIPPITVRLTRSAM